MSTAFDLLSMNLPVASGVGTPLNNSAAATTLASIPIPDQFINAVGRSARVRFTGHTSCVGVNDTLSFDILLGATEIAAIASFKPGLQSSEGWVIDVDFTTTIDGVGGAVAYSVFPTNLDGTGVSFPGAGTANVNFDSESGISLILQATWGAAVDGDSVTCNQALLVLGGLR